MINEKKPRSHVQRRAEEAKASRRYVKIIPPILGLCAALLIIVYVTSLLFTQYGNFSISVKDFGDSSYALSLCENDTFNKATSKLSAQQVANVNNITYTNLPDNLNDVNGSHNGENYLAYTFYVKNSGEKDCSYKYSMVITQATAGVDAAVRVRIYFNPRYYVASENAYNHSGNYVDYAKPKTGGNGVAEVDPGNRGMTNFISNDVISEVQTDNFKPGDISKITVVIWLEGEDPDCTNDVLGGRFKTDMNLEIIDV